MIFYLELLDIGKTALPLPVYVLAQLRAGEHFLLVFHYEEVGRFHKENGIQPLSFNDAFAHTVHFTDHVVLHLPFVDGCRIVSNAACGKMGH